MAYRFTNTDKWGDSWFSNLDVKEKLLFTYLCDACDIGGFIEINKAIWSAHTGMTIQAIEGALEGLERGLMYSKDGDCLYIRNFLKHQKNLPINENNKAHRGILRRFELYSHKFDIQDIMEFIKGASKGLLSPTGKGKGNIGGFKGGEKEPKKTTKETYIEWMHNSQDPVYKKFISWLLDEDVPNCMRMDDQIDEKKFTKLYAEAKRDNALIKRTINNMENKPDLNKKYTSFYRTLTNWVKLEIERRGK
jgi:hypothetical protein